MTDTDRIGQTPSLLERYLVLFYYGIKINCRYSPKSAVTVNILFNCLRVYSHNRKHQVGTLASGRVAAFVQRYTYVRTYVHAICLSANKHTGKENKHARETEGQPCRRYLRAVAMPVICIWGL